MAEKPGLPSAHRRTALLHTSEIVAAYVSNHTLSITEVSALIRNVCDTISDLSTMDSTGSNSNLKPAVPIKKSVTPEYIVCLEDGKKLKMLKRYLRTHYHLSPEAYRAKWHLPANYPMVAPNYAEARSQTAKEHGLGKRRARTDKRRKRS